MNKIRYFFDFEFATKYIKNKDEILSVGLVVTQGYNPEPIHSYYTVTKLTNEKGIIKHSLKVSGITIDEMRKGKPFSDVLCDLSIILSKYPADEIYVWGDRDAVVYKSSCQFVKKEIHTKDLWKKFIDFQIIFGKSVILEDRTYNIAWSLKDAKSFYCIDGEVTHNAYDDASDLKNIFMASKYNQPLDWQKIKSRSEKLKKNDFFRNFKSVDNERTQSLNTNNISKRDKNLKYDKVYRNLDRFTWEQLHKKYIILNKPFSWHTLIEFKSDGIQYLKTNTFMPLNQISLVISEPNITGTEYRQIILKDTVSNKLLLKGRIESNDELNTEIKEIFLLLENLDEKQKQKKKRKN